jgi:alkylation response protein AidB-like acyl-CoA dehydrogenase
MTTTHPASVLAEAILQGCKERAPGYDRDNTFFDEDFKQLKEVGYLLSAVPKELGGLWTPPWTCRVGSASSKRVGLNACDATPA